MEKIVETWLEKEEQCGKNEGNLIRKIDNGFIKKGKTVVWNGQLYDAIKHLFRDCSFLHCYSVHRDNNYRVIHYNDFSIQENIHRFYFYEENGDIRWHMTVKRKGNKSFNDGSYRRIYEDEISMICQLVNHFFDALKNLPTYRLPLIVGDMSIKKAYGTSAFVECLEELHLKIAV